MTKQLPCAEWNNSIERVNIGSMYCFSIGWWWSKQGLALGLASMTTAMSHKKGVWSSPAKGPLKIHTAFSQSPWLPIQEHFPVTVLWEVATVQAYSLRRAKPLCNSEELVFSSDKGISFSYGFAEVEIGIYWLLICCLPTLISIWSTNMTKEELPSAKPIWLPLLNPETAPPWDIIPLSAGHWVLCPEGCQRFYPDGVNCSAPSALPAAVAQDALKIILSFHVEWGSRSGVCKANFHF